MDGQLSIGSRSYGSQFYPIKKRNFSPAAVAPILLYGHTTFMLTKYIEKKLDGNCTNMLGAVLNKFWLQHPTKQHLYGHLPSISKTIQIRRTRHGAHCWRSKGKFRSYVFQWTPSNGWVSVGRPSWTYLQQLCTDKRCNLDDQQWAMDDRDEWWEKVEETWASGMIMMIYLKIISIYLGILEPI